MRFGNHKKNRALAPKFFLALAFAAAPAVADLPTTAITLHPPNAEPRTLTVEIAHTPAAREKGLSNRATLVANAGMLFLFPTPRRVCMWMKDTQIPLVAAFINEQNIVTQTAAMRPHTTTRHCAATPTPAVLETTPQTSPPLHTRIPLPRHARSPSGYPEQ